ncbi:phosphoribosylanthranilate isomerase [Brevundimonas viscosa]|uniref:N-(5'-phosphoribosyl)anthranilate isomerase n=1 Tax=Brevundimonas viscosa TaxID=871741 RepID=A0A1I6NWN2_9CAUL|nr:phosphoribosylanthranilate isomerase [Brevundimonas viscosa]SFS32314.1 phosphoribosylanthranilate isomerase [Brevundimonas viscosa]
MSVLTKICGLTTPGALDAALDGGADFVGAVSFPKSPRHLELIAAAALFERARGRARVVAVTADADDALLTEIALILRPDLVQLHGSETPEQAARAGLLTGAGIIKALPVRTADDVASAAAFEPVVDWLMFDAKPPEGAALPGGVGAAFDWALLAGRAFARPWFLAGGLSPDNLAEAVRITGAPAVDVSSGVESAPGVKDPGRIAAFLEAARSA